MDIHSVKSTEDLTVTVRGTMFSLLQKFTIWTYFERTLLKHSIKVSMCASIYEK